MVSVMANVEVLNQQEITDVLSVMRNGRTVCKMSYLAKGLWHVVKVRICEISRLTLQIELLSDLDGGDLAVDIDQPVGIVFYHDLMKYMFEASVIGFDSDVSDGHDGRLIVNFPDFCERVHRRVYDRVAVPEYLRVDVLFWHRGYTDGHGGAPVENYWQGALVDLSAGGLLMSVEDRFNLDYRDGQLIGLQFTPLPQEKPLLVEGQIRHIAGGTDGCAHLGIEFVGLEARSEGSDKIGRIVETLRAYGEAASRIER